MILFIGKGLKLFSSTVTCYHVRSVAMITHSTVGLDLNNIL